tara:strand:+ start:284 stop:463 length:180 start_codon:yes stop_codon:yes gene_type:complete
MKRLEQIVAIFIAAGLAIPSYWFFWTLAGGGGYDRRIKPSNGNVIRQSSLKPSSDFDKP